MHEMPSQCPRPPEPVVPAVQRRKSCSRCKSIKDLTEFHRDNARKDGRQGVCKSCKSEITAGWARRNRKRKNETDATFKRRRRDRDGAHTKVKRAIKAGKLVPFGWCEICGEEAKTEGHHTDYSKPLEVMWLCKQCHGRAHSEDGL